MNWIAIVPLNYGRPCKTRLANCLTDAQRTALVESMARHILRQLKMVPSVEQIHLLSPACPPFAADLWIEDEGRGLNHELAAVRVRFPGRPVLFIHADLPLIKASEIALLLDAAAQSGVAIAPDHTGRGTNALAIADARTFTPAFGPDSLEAHQAALPDAAIVELEGLALDVDEPDCLAQAIARGFQVPFDVP